MIETATRYHSLGYNVVPVSQGKVPTVEWKKWQTERQTKEEVEAIFKNNPWGIAIITGFNDIEVIDIDVKNDPNKSVLKDYSSRCTDLDVNVNGIVAEKTQNGGAHLIYKTKDTGRNQPLAKYNVDGKLLTVIETRSDGGIFVIAPSPGYTFFNGRDLSDVDYIDTETRDNLFDVARSFNQGYNLKLKDYKSKDDSRVSVWQDFNDKHDYTYLQDALENLGWKELYTGGNNIHYRRPGKTSGNSGDIHMGLNIFKQWSSNGYPFEPEVGYTPFDVYALLNHNGDGSAAAKDLYHQGYGDRYEEEDDGTYTFDPSKPPKESDPCMWAYQFNQYMPFMREDGIMALAGRSGVGKSTALQAMIASALSGNKFLDIKIDLKNRDILVIDTEQGKGDIFSQGQNVMKMINATSNISRYQVKGIAYLKRKKEDKRRMSYIRRSKIDSLIDSHKGDLGWIIIDNVRDLVVNFNDVDAALEFADWVKEIRARSGAIITLVIHTTKTLDEMKGSLGTIMDELCQVYLKIVGHKDEGYSEIKPIKTRGFKPFSAIEFTWNENGIPVIHRDSYGMAGFRKN